MAAYMKLLQCLSGTIDYIDRDADSSDYCDTFHMFLPPLMKQTHPEDGDAKYVRNCGTNAPRKM
jgi:hypothetical protein